MAPETSASGSEAVFYDRKARFSDCDAQGIVFNATYLVYWDDTFTDYLDAIDLPWDDMVARGDDVLLARTEIDYRNSAQLGDVIRTTARVSRIGRTSIVFEYTSVNPATGMKLAEGRQIQVIVDHETMRPKPVPDYLRAMIAAHEGWQPSS